MTNEPDSKLFFALTDLEGWKAENRKALHIQLASCTTSLVQTIVQGNCSLEEWKSIESGIIILSPSSVPELSRLMVNEKSFSNPEVQKLVNKGLISNETRDSIVKRVLKSPKIVKSYHAHLSFNSMNESDTLINIVDFFELEKFMNDSLLKVVEHIMMDKSEKGILKIEQWNGFNSMAIAFGDKETISDFLTPDENIIKKVEMDIKIDNIQNSLEIIKNKNKLKKQIPSHILIGIISGLIVWIITKYL